MVGIRNTVPCLLKMRGQDAKWVVVKREISYHPNNTGSLIMHKAEGIRKKMKKVPQRFMQRIELPEERVYIYPGGTWNGVLNPSTTMFVCCVRDECNKDLMRKVAALKETNGKLVKKKNEIKSELEKKVKSLETKLEDIMAQQAMKK